MEPGDGEWEKLKSSLLEFGIAESLTWNKRTGNLVGGHQRLRVLIAEFEIPGNKIDVCVVDLPLTKEKALNIALNKIDGWWDTDKLAAELAELKVGNVDEFLSGFDEAEIDKLISDFVDNELDLEEEPKTDGVKLADRGANLSIQIGPDVLQYIDAEAKSKESSRAGVGRRIIEEWAKKKMKRTKLKKVAKRSASKSSSKQRSGRQASSQGKRSKKSANRR